MLQPTLENFMLQNEQLAKQVIQYKSRIKKLESEALEMNKNIMGLEELCKDYKDQIEQLTNQGPCE
jgi:predicted  nucleic acid-binding Zn-ribbon protein